MKLAPPSSVAVPDRGDVRGGSAAERGAAQVDVRVGGPDLLQGPQQVILRRHPLP